MPALTMLQDREVARMDARRARLRLLVAAAALAMASGVLAIAQVASADAGGERAATASLASAGRVYALQKCTAPVFKPRGLVTTCGSGNFAYEKLRWSRWNRVSARARGYVAIRDTSAAHSGIVHVPVALTLSRPVQCDESNRLVYSYESYRLLRRVVGYRQSGSGRLLAFC